MTEKMSEKPATAPEFKKFSVTVTLDGMTVSDTIEARTACSAFSIIRTKLHPLFPAFDDHCTSINIHEAYSDNF